jgi:hypothetical protein
MEMNTDKFAQLAETIARQCFGGWIPPEPELICEAVLRAIPQIFKTASEEETQVFTDRLLAALRARIALNNARWLA